MKRLFIGFLLAFSIFCVVYAQSAFIRDFRAGTNGQEVLIEWTSAAETGLTEFRLQRSMDGVHFNTIHTAQPAGDNHNYTYTDSDLFKNTGRTCYYRIEIATTGQRLDYSSVEEVALSFSGIHRTWGSIKAMFR
jgi:hypothetical protein